MLIDVDASYADVVARLPAELQGFARDLPRRLGWERWSEYVTLEPFRELPVFAAEAPDIPGVLQVQDEQLEAYRVAHHRGGFWGVTIDHLIDRQMEDSAQLRALLSKLEEAWREALGAASADPETGRSCIDEARALWEAGVQMEQRACLAGRSTPRDYRALVHLKTQWLTLPARQLLAHFEPSGSARRAAFAEACELMMLASQCLDDALDAEEDARVRHIDFPSLLRVSQTTLANAAPALLYRAAGLAGAARFHGFARWLASHADAVDRSLAPSRGLADRVASWLFLADMLA